MTAAADFRALAAQAEAEAAPGTSILDMLGHMARFYAGRPGRCSPPERWYTVRRVDEQAELAVALPAVVGLAGGARAWGMTTEVAHTNGRKE